MAYKITLKTGLDIGYCGYETAYSIDFIFTEQKANVTVDINPNDPTKATLSSNTDGYHWLQFFLCQEPGAATLKDNLLPYLERKICEDIFKGIGIDYEQEDKETATLSFDEPVTMEIVEKIANLIEPRFANRERFFKDPIHQ